MMYWVCRKIGFFFFLTVLKMEMVTENQRRVLPLLFWAWGWVTGARAWGTPPWTTGKRLTPSLRPPAPVPRSTSVPGPLGNFPAWSAPQGS